MKIEGISQQSTTYINPKPEVVKSKDPAPAEPSVNERTSSLEIIGYTKQHPGYQPTIQEKLLIQAIEQANQKVLGPNKEFEFSIHQKTKQIMVKVLDSSTKEVIREIPAEKVLDAVAHMWEMAGIFVDEKR